MKARKPKRLYTDWRFHTPNQRAYFCLAHSQGVAEPTDHIYSFTLTTGRLYGHWHTQTRTGPHCQNSKMHPDPFVEMHPDDAANLHLKDGDWVEVRSRRGQVCLPVILTKAIRPGTLFVPMHWGFLFADSGEANQLTHPIACPGLKAARTQSLCGAGAAPEVAADAPYPHHAGKRHCPQAIIESDSLWRVMAIDVPLLCV